ncbi:MAG: nitroreductase family protein [Actinomycetota bacterium]|nr:nitroreductase family protein [Actinomycetota bacterium]
MDVHEAISTQRAIREFVDRPISEEHLDRIVQAGRRAPSSKNEQPRSFIVCTERGHLRELSTVGDYAQHIAGAAAAIAIITPDAKEGWRREIIAFDAGHSAQNMMLSAWELGVGSVHAAVYDEPLTRKLLGYPQGFRCDYLISFGYPKDPAVMMAPLRNGGRRSSEEVVHRERW